MDFNFYKWENGKGPIEKHPKFANYMNSRYCVLFSYRNSEVGTESCWRWDAWDWERCVELEYETVDFWYENGVWKFIYLSNELIAGFDEAISYLNKGAEGTFLIPSDLAYGSTGNFNRTIPPYSPLVFNIKLIDIYE